MLLGLSGALMMLQSESGAGLACIFLRATLRSSGRRLPEPMWVRSAYTCSMQSVVGSARSSALPHCLGHSPPRLLKKCTGNGAKRACIMAAGKCVEFSKYQGLGNDFILVCSLRVSSCEAAVAQDDPMLLQLQVDNRQHAEPLIDSTQAVQLCDRHFGVGADGVR